MLYLSDNMHETEYAVIIGIAFCSYLETCHSEVRGLKYELNSLVAAHHLIYVTLLM